MTADYVAQPVLDEQARAVLATIIGPPAWHPAITLGHLIGSLDHQQAAQFANRCDQLTTTTIPATIDNDGRVLLQFPDAREAAA